MVDKVETAELVAYAFYVVFGVIAVLANTFVILAIVWDRTLRKKYVLLVALAGGDLLRGFSASAGGIERGIKIFAKKHLENTTRWDCMHTVFMPTNLLGGQIPGLIEVMISIERLYMTWWLLSMSSS